MDAELIIMDSLKAKEAELERNLSETIEQNDRHSLIKSYIEAVGKELPDRPSIEFPSQWEWPNLESEPLSLEANLRGRLTLLDFFTYCCINCMHLLPDLEAIEAEFSPTDLLIIGVHSAKFENERKSTNIGNAAARYDIHHPVVNDPQAILWKRLEIICWPTILVLDPLGKPIKFFIGEGKREAIREFLKVAIETYRGLGLMTATRESVPRLKSDSDSTDCVDGRNKILKYPGKMSTDETGNRIFVSDSGHHRVVVVGLKSGSVEKVFGDGVRGFRDGDFETARFSSPQGLCFRGPNELYVCDTGNHSIRLINLDSGLVSTVAGSGSRGNDLDGGKIGSEQVISSPWDLCLGFSPEMLKSVEVKHPDVIYIAMAGSHQIWAYALDDVTFWKGQHFPAKSCFRVAGNGAEENRNNSYPARAAFAQPSGICFDRISGIIFVADSESSSVRSVSLTDNGAVKGVCGASKNPMDLFSFGDVDGKGCDAKLQHPLAVVTTRRKRRSENGEVDEEESVVVVADSYNHKLKIVTELKSKNPNCSTIDLKGVSAKLDEPGGLALSHDGSTLYVCDTNNHSIKTVDLNSFKVSVFEIKDQISAEDETGNISESINVGVHLSGGSVDLQVILSLPAGWKLNPEAPNSWKVSLPDHDWTTESGDSSGDISTTEFKIKLNHKNVEVGSCRKIGIRFNLFLCSSESGLCSVDKRFVDLIATSDPESREKNKAKTFTLNLSK